MTFVVSARKYRPQKFSEVVGQDHITATLKNSLDSGRIAHAFLFTGPRGVGKTTTARILAKALNCLKEGALDPCGECENCVQIQDNRFLDIIEIDAASNRGIDDVRALRESVKFAPIKGKYKVFIIDEVHMLTKESFNAFLKTLEEPPPHTIFIFATTEIHKVPITIVSRCQRYDFRRIGLDFIRKQLQEIAANEGVIIDDRTLTLISRRADGGLRDAESFFDQVRAFCGQNVQYDEVTRLLSVIGDELFFNVSDAVLTKNHLEGLNIVNLIYSNGWDFVEFFNGLVEHYRNILTVAVSGSANFIESAEVFKLRYEAYNKDYSVSDCLRILNFLNRALIELRYSSDHKLKAEIVLSLLIGFESSNTLSKMIYEAKALPTEVQTVKKGSAPHNSGERNSADYSKDKEQSELNSRAELKTEPVHAISDAESTEIDTIRRNWERFTAAVLNEKRFTFGESLSFMEPKEYNGSKLTADINDKDSFLIIDQNIEYLEKKASSFFNRRIAFNLRQTEGSALPKANLIQPETIDTPKKTNGVGSDPELKRIIERFDGREFS